MKSNINYREVTGEQLFDMLKEVFLLTREEFRNNNDIKMWIQKDKNYIYLKNAEINRFDELLFDFDFTEKQDLGVDEMISYVKLKRTFLKGGSKKLKFHGFDMEKNVRTESWKKYSFNHFERSGVRRSLISGLSMLADVTRATPVSTRFSTVSPRICRTMVLTPR